MSESIFHLGECTYCGICNPSCPFFHVLRKEHLSPRAWTYSLNNHPQSFSTLLKLAKNCFFCFRCFADCPLKVNYPGALLYSLFKELLSSGFVFLYHEEENSVYLQCRLPRELQLGFQSYPFPLDKKTSLSSSTGFQALFPGKKIYINTYFFHLVKRLTAYYQLTFPFSALPGYWNLGQLITSDEFFSVLPVIPEFLPSSTLQVKIPKISELVQEPSLLQRIQEAE